MTSTNDYSATAETEAATSSEIKKAASVKGRLRDSAPLHVLTSTLRADP